MTIDDLHDLLGTKTENARLDYKERFNWKTSSKSEKGEIIKDILSFANLAGGGRIVFGVRDSDYEPIGLDVVDYESFDPTTLNAYLQQYTEPIHTCRLFKFNDNGRYFVVIEIPEFASEPIICKKDLLTNRGKTVLQRGSLYIRKESAESSKVDSAAEMRELLNRALKHRADELLKSIQTLLSGSTPIEPETSVFEESLSYAVSQVEKNIGEVISKNNLGFFTVTIRPHTDISVEIGDIFDLRERLRRSQISYRGWSFPHVQRNRDHGNSFNITGGITSYTQWERHVESFCLFTNGLFYCKSAMWEDSGILESRQRKVLSYISLIYHTLEFVLFVNQFYDFGETKPDIDLHVTLNGCLGRRLVSFDPKVDLFEDYTSHVESINDAKVVFNVAESIADPKPFSARLVRKIFQYFNLRIENNMLEFWQNKFISRQF